MTNLAGSAGVALAIGVGAVLMWRACPPRGWVGPWTPGRLLTVVWLTLVAVGSVLLLASGTSSGDGPALAAAGFLAVAVGASLAARRHTDAPANAGRSSEPATPHRARLLVVLALAALGAAALASIAARVGVPFLTSEPSLTRLSYAGLTFDLFRWLVPPAALLALAVALRRRTRIAWVVAAAALGTVLAIEFALASRALPLELALATGIVLTASGRRVPPTVVVTAAAVALVLFVGVLALRTPRDDPRAAADPLGAAVARTVDRLLLIHPRTLEVLVTEIPEQEPPLLGASYVSRPLAALTGSPRAEPLERWLYRRLFPEQSATTAGSAAPGVLGEAWANFGIGALLVMLAFGAVVQRAVLSLSRLPARPVDVVLLALLSVAVARGYAASLNGVLATTAVAIAWWALAGGLPTRRSRGSQAPASVLADAPAESAGGATT